MEDSPMSKKPLCIATTGLLYQSSLGESCKCEAARLNLPHEHGKESNAGRPGWEEESNVFKAAEWSLDGSTILTNNEDNKVRTFVLPPNLLEETEDGKPHELVPWAISDSPGPVYCTALYPHFSLSDPSTTLYLRSTPSLPLTLSQSLTSNAKALASYRLVSRTTEAYLPTYSLSYLSPALFAAGSINLIAVFDLYRPAPSPPLMVLPTIPSRRHKLKGGGVGIRGIVSALAHESEQGVLAAGTFTRWVGLYDLPRSGESVAVFPIVADDEKNAEGGMFEGTGVTGLNWSPCGRYLFVSERKSDGVQVYDVRVTGRRVGWLGGRRADGNQRLAVSVRTGKEGGVEVWGGGTDGVARVWEWKDGTEGTKELSWQWEAGQDPITAAMVHPSGVVAATCSGQRHILDMVGKDSDSRQEESEDDGGEVSRSPPPPSSSVTRSTRSLPVKPFFDNTLKIWKL